MGDLQNLKKKNNTTARISSLIKLACHLLHELNNLLQYDEIND